MQGQDITWLASAWSSEISLGISSPRFDVNASVQEAERGMMTRSSGPIGKNSGSTHHVIPKTEKMLVKVNLDLVKKKKKGWFQVQLQDHLWRWGWSLFLLQVILGNMNNMNLWGRVSIIYYIKYVELKRTKGGLEWLPWCATKLYLNVLVTDNFILSSLFEFSSVKEKCLTQGDTVSPGHSASNDTLWWCKCLISFHKEGYSEGPSQHSCPWDWPRPPLIMHQSSNPFLSNPNFFMSLEVLILRTLLNKILTCQLISINLLLGKLYVIHGQHEFFSSKTKRPKYDPVLSN